MLLRALHLETMDDEGEATPFLALEMEGADVAFLDVGVVAKHDQFVFMGGPLVSSKHEASVAAHGAVSKLD